MLQQQPFGASWSSDVIRGSDDPSSLFTFTAAPRPLVQEWMLHSVIPLVLNFGLPLLGTALVLAPSVVGAVDRVLPRYLVWEDMLGSPVSASGEEGLKPAAKGLPSWKRGAFALLSAAVALLCAAVAGDRLNQRASDDGNGQLFGWTWLPVAEAVTLTLVWLVLAANSALRPSPTPVYAAVAVHLSLFFSSILTTALAVASSVAIPTHTTLSLGLLVGLLALDLSLPVNALPDDAFVHPPGIGGRSPEEEASLWSWITYSFLSPLLALGWGKKLDDDEVWRIGPLRASGPARARFEAYRAAHPGRSLFHCITLLNTRGLLGDLICSLLCIGLQYTSPYCLKQVLDAIEDPSPAAIRKAYVFAATAMGASVVKAILSGFSRRSGSGAEIRTRGALMGAIYSKALMRKDHSGVVGSKESDAAAKPASKAKGSRAKAAAAKKTAHKATGADIGKIVSLLSNDVTRISNRITNASDLYSPPIEVLVASVFLYQLLGLSAFAGSVGLLVLLPFNSYLRDRAVKINKHTTEARDARMTVMNELILGIKPLKFFAWEERWTAKAHEAREEELKWILSGRTNAVLFNIVWGLSPLLITLVSFWSFITLGHGQLTVSTAFTSLSLYSMLSGPLSQIPAQLVVWAQSRLSLDRLEAFLQEPEIPEFVSTLHRAPAKDVDGRLAIEKGTFRWVADPSEVWDDSSFELGGADAGIDVDFPKGKLTVLSGPVGSGKTALLLALLGELDCVGGTLHLPKSGRSLPNGLVDGIAYCAQTPFLQHRSIKDNILYGAPFDQERYEAVLFACALTHDLDNLEDGDSTEIGVRGVVLSGGQKSRLAVARALYSSAAVCLFDDPLAALDSGTAKHLIKHGLTGPLMKGRTVVLASHHLDVLLPLSDYLVKMHQGTIALQGSVSDLRARGLLPSLVAEDESETLTAGPVLSEAAQEEAFDAAVKSEASRSTKKAKKLIEAEARSEKNVSWGVYLLYIRASGIALWALTALLLCVHQGSSQLSRFWLKIWGEAYGKGDEGYEYLGLHLPSALDRPLFYLSVYAAISLAILLVATLQISTSYMASYHAAVSLHDRLLLRVARATLRTFDTIPGGRILARFSADVAALDGNLAITLRTTLAWTASAIVSVAVILAVEPYFALPALVISLAYGRISQVYARTSRDLRRMMSNARSPLFSDFGELLDGIVTCRAYSSERRFLAAFEDDVDLLLAKIYFNWATNRWLLLRFDVLGALATFLSMAFAIYFSVSSGSSAMAILSTQSFVSALYWLCRNLTGIELAMNAVERIAEYLLLPQEAPWVIEDQRPPAAWPVAERGKPLIQVKDLVIKYDPSLPDVLHGVSFDIPAGAKVGLVGRTGSGKSTLALSLLRAFEPAGGSIVVDGVDIIQIGVQDLRSRITIVLQDAFLAKGTLRANLDPWGQHTDVELLDMLRRVHLISSPTSTAPSTASSSAASFLSTAVPATPSSTTVESITPTLVPETPSAAPSVREVGRAEIHLDSPVSAGGANFSAGQRQLLALARALLRGNNIVILDEASSAIDMATDDLIQQTIREELADKCVLTIAHRLSTVIDNDLLLVLQDGRIAEYDTPAALLAKEGGLFRSMALESGSLEQLHDASRRSKAAGTL